MKPISKIKCGIKPLEAALNNLVDAINRRTISTGYGLTKEEGESGVIIRLQTREQGADSTPPAAAAPQDDPWRYTPDNQTAGWQSVHVMDENCNSFSMWVWGGQPK